MAEKTGLVAEASGWSGPVARVLGLVIPFLVFAAVLSSTLPPWLLFASRHSLLPVVGIALASLAFCYWSRNWIGTIAGLSATLALFALPLAALWQDAAFHGNAVGGLLPWSDASGYYYDARRLLDGHLLGWSARRPLFVGLLATLLAVTGQNLQIVIALMVAINGVACFLFGRELRESHGPGAAALGATVLFLFYRVYGGLGTTLTENLGFALAVCGFTALLRGTRTLDPRSLFIGLGLVTVGLFARAGAYFVLPALVLAVGSMFKPTRRWFRAGSAALATILFTAILALGLGRSLADPVAGSTDFSNFSSSLYGLVAGGKGWSQIQQDHPTATEGPEVYRLAYRAFVDRPTGIVQGSLKALREYLNPTGPHNAFAFLGPPLIQSGPIGMCYVLSAVALITSLFRMKQPLHALVAAVAIGHLASIPFVPPSDGGGRVYAATVPILAILIVVGLDALWQAMVRAFPVLSRLKAPMVVQGNVDAGWPRAAEWLGVFLAVTGLVGPFIILSFAHPIRLVALKCDAGTMPVHVRISEGSFLRVRGDSYDARLENAATQVSESRLAVSAGRNELGGAASRFTDGNTLFNGYDLNSGRYVWLVAPTEQLVTTPAVYAICGRESEDPVARQYGVFFADAVWLTTDSRP